MILGALGSVALLLAGALAVAVLEPRLVRGGEPGPAHPVPIRTAVRPWRRDPWMYVAGPVLALLAVCLGAIVIPLGPDLVGADLSIGLFYFIVVVDLIVVAIALSGWGANTASSVEACYRVVAQLVAYVIPLGLAIIGPIMMARSMSTVDIVQAQEQADLWYVVAQPGSFVLYLVTGLMQSYRAPFLEPFAGRIGAGVLGVSGGWTGLLWRVALSGLLFLVAAMGAVLFLGGWDGPLLPGPVWMAIKTLALVGLLLWAGARARPRSTAGMLALSWKILIPAGLANVLVVGALILLGVGQEPF